jgi:protein-disulfide isomerase
VNGTPTFYVNGVRHDGGYTLDELLEAVDEAAEAGTPT